MALVVLVAMGGGALLSLSFGKKGGAAEISEIGVATDGMGELPLFPLLIKREGGGRFALPNIEATHDLSHDAAFDACH